MSSLLNQLPDNLYPEEIPSALNLFSGSSDSVAHYNQMATGKGGGEAVRRRGSEEGRGRKRRRERANDGCIDRWMQKWMEGETDGKMGGALGIFRGASCFSHPLLPPSEIGKAWLATPRLRLRFSRVGAAADRREVGASSSGVLPHHAGGPIAGLGARRGAVAPFLGRSPASFSPALSPPLTPSASHPGWSHVRRGVPAVGEVLRRCLSGAFSKAIGGVGTAGRGRGLTHGAGERVCHRGRSWDPGAWERQLLPLWRHRPVFRCSPLSAGSRLFPSSTSRKLLQAGRRLGPGEAPFTGGTLLRSEDKSVEALWVGHPGLSARRGTTLGA